MNCTDARKLLQDYATRELAPELRRLVDEHLAGCETCREELALVALVVSGLSRLPASEPRPDFNARVLAALPRQQRSLHPAWALMLLPVLTGLAWLFRAELTGPVLRLLVRVEALLPLPGALSAELGGLMTAEPLLVAGAVFLLSFGALTGAVWYCWTACCAE